MLSSFECANQQGRQSTWKSSRANPSTEPMAHRNWAASIVQLWMTPGRSMNQPKGCLFGVLSRRPSTMAYGSGLTGQSRCYSGSFQPGKAEVIPALIHPPNGLAISADKDVL